MEKALFGKLDATDKKDIENLEKLMEEKRKKEDLPDEESKLVPGYTSNHSQAIVKVLKQGGESDVISC